MRLLSANSDLKAAELNECCDGKRAKGCRFRKSYSEIGMATMRPHRWTARCKGASFCDAKCVRATHQRSAFGSSTLGAGRRSVAVPGIRTVRVYGYQTGNDNLQPVSETGNATSTPFTTWSTQRGPLVVLAVLLGVADIKVGHELIITAAIEDLIGITRLRAEA